MITYFMRSMQITNINKRSIEMLKSKDNIQKYEEDVPETSENNYFIERPSSKEVEKINCTENKYVCGSIGSGVTNRMIHFENEIETSHQTENLYKK